MCLLVQVMCYPTAQRPMRKLIHQTPVIRIRMRMRLVVIHLTEQWVVNLVASLVAQREKKATSTSSQAMYQEKD